ncbi:autoinducer synthase [Enterovibrio norvegicus FF-33]|uniref:acyl-homoserine-lactone synthase n=1 Tax=Enterovibrio norvegicus TaxID=188144 RepID=UPI0002DD7AC8|nr:acyl-homoserine-lactone synthase [Enterovibrio norvegicus]OEE65943.1 autoinducer synthase [Enterovibrio norvegicus FF-33]
MYDTMATQTPATSKLSVQCQLEKMATLSPSEQNNHAFLELVNDYMFSTNQFDLFERIVSYRSNEITKALPSTQPRGNLFTTLTCDTARSITGVTPFRNLPEIFLSIERIALAFYGDILGCWAAFKVSQLISEAENHLVKHSSMPRGKLHTAPDNDRYRYEVVTDIRDDQRLFLTNYSPVPMKLSLANVLINLETFVKQQHWYEMLYYLDVSSYGEHFILYQENDNSPPLLLSTALIQRWQHRDNWLTFDPFFQTESWTLIASNEKIQTLERSGIFHKPLKNKLNLGSVAAFDYSLLQTITQKRAVCEIIRMAIGGPREKLNHILYLTLKYLTVKLADIGLEAAYTIVEQPSILAFYGSVNNDSKGTLPYVSICQQKVEGTDLTTYQGIVFTGPMSQAFEHCSFRDYNKRIIKMRRQARTAENA